MKKMYTISYTDNSGNRRTHGRYKKKSDAMKEIKKVLEKPKKNKYGVKLTSYRTAGAWGGFGINNPRLKKITTKY
jgi:hypothetical protein